MTTVDHTAIRLSIPYARFSVTPVNAYGEVGRRAGVRIGGHVVFGRVAARDRVGAFADVGVRPPARRVRVQH